jgi:hypothetical protein
MAAIRGCSALAGDASPGGLDRLGIGGRSPLFLVVDPKRLRMRLLPVVGAKRVVVRLPGQEPVEDVLHVHEDVETVPRGTADERHSGFRVIRIEGRQGVLHDERHRRVIRADDRARPHHLPEVRDQGSDEMSGRFQDVQKRVPSGRPAARREEILLAVDGKLGLSAKPKVASGLPFPDRYASTATSGLAFTVQPGANTFELSLKR